MLSRCKSNRAIREEQLRGHWAAAKCAGKLHIAFVGLLLSCCTYGCGPRSDFEFAPVAGQVTLNGQPLADARIGFEPIARPGAMAAGGGSYGRTDAEGHFQLSTVKGIDGAVVGNHRVWIRTIKTDANGKVLEKEYLPRQFHDDTMLTFEVPEDGTEVADFALSAKLE